MTDDETNNICVMRAVIPPGVTVPLHRHDDFEDFLMLSGGHEVLIERDGGLQWYEAHAGDYIRVPGAPNGPAMKRVAVKADRPQ